MIVIGKKVRNQPAPPHVVFEALIEPDRDPSRPWLELLDDEVRPVVLRAEVPLSVAWSSLWSERPDAAIQFDLPTGTRGGTDLCWTLLVDEPLPDDALIRQMRQRVNKLINGNLRNTFGQ